MELDVRKLLVAEIENRKKRNAQYSLRSFARYLEVSPAQLSQLISGRRTLTLKMLQRICDKLTLAPTEREQLFRSWSQAQFSEELPVYHKQLSTDEFRLVSEWYHFAILGLAKIAGASARPDWISEQLGISINESQEALKRLRRLGLLAAGTRLEQVGPPVQVSSPVPSQAIRRYHSGLLTKALESLDHDSVEERDFSALNYAIQGKHLEKYKRLIEAFQDELSRVIEKDNKKGSADRLYALTCGLFPLQRRRRGFAP